MTPAERVLRAKLASHASWANTPDAERAARTAPARRKSPVTIEYWLDRYPDDPKAAESAHKAEMTRRSLSSARKRAARRRSA